MSARTILMAVLAIAAGVSSVVGVSQLARLNRSAQPADTVTVVISKASVARGERLTENDLTVQLWPANLVPIGVSTDLKAVEGRVTLAAQFPGQPIFNSQLAPKDAPSGLAALVPEGMRAFTIRMPNVQSNVAGFVLPGNKVDVLLTVNSSAESGGGAVTVTLIQAVEILAVDQKLDAPAKNKIDTAEFQSVTLLVTPKQASKLSLAGNKGTLQLALRNGEDDDAKGPGPITMADLEDLTITKLLGSREPARVTPAAAAAPIPQQQEMRVRALRGSFDSVITVRPFEVNSNSKNASPEIQETSSER